MSDLRPEFESQRKGKFKVDNKFEAILQKANQSLETIERDLIKDTKDNGQPLLIICYPPRSGSTYLAQLLVRTDRFNYISNFIARFWDAPYFAGLLEKKINLRSFEIINHIKNKYGVTDSVADPHEFGFFWNKWFAYKQATHRIQKINHDLKIFHQELIALKSLYDQPMFIKNGIVALNPALMSEIFTNIKFILIRRDPVFIAQSIFQARKDLYDDPAEFWSTRPSTYHEIKNLPVYDQIAYQIKDIYDDIYNDLDKAGADFFLVEYEDLAANPLECLSSLMSFLKMEIEFDDSFKTSIGSSEINQVYIDPNDFDELKKAISNIF